MASKYLTSDGDTVDLIAWKHYGSLDGSVMEQVLSANIGLAEYGPVLPAGVIVVLPDISTTGTTTGVKLWD